MYGKKGPSPEQGGGMGGTLLNGLDKPTLRSQPDASMKAQ